MKICNLNANYIKYILYEERFPNFPFHGIGICIFLNEKHIFIPISSVKKSFKENDNRFFSIGNKNKFGTLFISSYVYITPNLVSEVDESPRILDEINFLRSKKEIFTKKLKFQINRSKGGHDDLKLKWLEGFITENNINQKMGLKYANKAIQSMAIFEKLKLSENEINDILNQKILGRTDSYEVETIINLKNSWSYLIKNLNSNLDLQYIIDINEKIAIHQALETGILRNKINSVSGEFEIPIPNKDQINNLIYRVNHNSSIEINALSLLYYIITEQWFFDGNKRTAIIIANKILLKNNIGLLIIEDFNINTFNSLLYNCYKTKSIDDKNRFIEFLSSKCIIRWA